MNNRFRYLLAFILLLALEVGIALYVHDGFIRPYLGDMLAVWGVYCLVRACAGRDIPLLPLYVFLFATAVECAQYFGLARLLGLSQVPVLGALLGATFDVQDFLMYFTGCALLALGWWAHRRRAARR